MNKLENVDTATKARQLLSDTIYYLNSKGYTHTISGGTLLGCKRNNQFIPYDDDIDIDIHLTSRKELDELISNDFKVKNYHTENYTWGYKIFDMSWPKLNISKWVRHCDDVRFQLCEQGIHYNRSKLWQTASKTYEPKLMNDTHYPYIDITLTMKDNDRYRNIDLNGSVINHWSRWNYTIDDIEKKQVRLFEGSQVFIPCSNHYLDNGYPGWKNTFLIKGRKADIRTEPYC